MTALLTRYATLTATVSMTQEEVEEQLHVEVWRNDWEEVLRLLALLPEPPSRRAASECLTLAVQKAPVEVVDAILALLPGEEYAA